MKNKYFRTIVSIIITGIFLFLAFGSEDEIKKPKLLTVSDCKSYIESKDLFSSYSGYKGFSRRGDIIIGEGNIYFSFKNGNVQYQKCDLAPYTIRNEKGGDGYSSNPYFVIEFIPTCVGDIIYFTIYLNDKMEFKLSAIDSKYFDYNESNKSGNPANRTISSGPVM